MNHECCWHLRRMAMVENSNSIRQHTEGCCHCGATRMRMEQSKPDPFHGPHFGPHVHWVVLEERVGAA